MNGVEHISVNIVMESMTCSDIQLLNVHHVILELMKMRFSKKRRDI